MGGGERYSKESRIQQIKTLPNFCICLLIVCKFISNSPHSLRKYRLRSCIHKAAIFLKPSAKRKETLPMIQTIRKTSVQRFSSYVKVLSTAEKLKNEMIFYHQTHKPFHVEGSSFPKSGFINMYKPIGTYTFNLY